jgi:uncharacterized protein (DUF779 family)
LSTLDLHFNRSIRDADAYVAPGGRYVLLVPFDAITRVSIASPTQAPSDGGVVILPPPTDGDGGGTETPPIVIVPPPTDGGSGSETPPIIPDQPGEMSFAAVAADESLGGTLISIGFPLDNAPVFTGDLNYGQLIGTPLQTVGLTGNKWCVLDTPNDLQFQAKRTDNQAGALYDVELKFQVSGLTAQRTDQLHRLAETRVTAIYADSNGRYWLLGYPQPLRVKVLQMGIDSDNGYAVALGGKQTVPPLEVANTVVNAALTHPFTEGDTFTNGPQVNYNPAPSGGSDSVAYGSLPYLAPANNYITGNTDIVLELQAGYTLFLDPTPAKGQYHVIKAKAGATANPVRVKGGPYYIDGGSEFLINSGTGAVTVIFSGSEWLVTAFAV